MSRAPTLTPQQALDAFHRRQVEEERWNLRGVPDGVVEAERRDARLRAEGWSEEAIRHRLDDGEDTPTHVGGLIDSYYGGSLTPEKIEYLGTVSAVRQRPRRVRVRFPWWRSGPE